LRRGMDKLLLLLIEVDTRVQGSQLTGHNAIHIQQNWKAAK
jgi:hypothetical protein